ncbi:hypothetical protein FRC10_007766, partial [Ceratobasidium sp. 414]
MSRFIIAFVLLLVTSLLTVTDTVPSPPPATTLITLVLIFSALIVIGHLYVHSVDFVQRIVAQYDCYELINWHTPGSKLYSDWYVLALLQIGAERLQQEVESVVSGWCQSLSHEVFNLIGRIITAPLTNALSRLQPYRDALPYSTLRIVVGLGCLVYLASLALRYAVARLAGLALSLYSACTPISVGLFITIVSILVYPFCEHLARCPAIKCIGAFWSYFGLACGADMNRLAESIYWTLRMTFSFEFDELYDKDHDFPASPEPAPRPEAVCAYADYLPNLDARQTYIRVTDCPTDVSPSKAPSPVRNQAYTGAAAGPRPRPSLNLARLAYEESPRMQVTSKSQVKLAAEKASDYCYVYRLKYHCFVAQPARSSSCSTVARRPIDNHSEPTPTRGVAPMLTDETTRLPGTMSLKGNQKPCSMTAEPKSSHRENTSNSHGQRIQTPAAPSTTSSPSHELPELVPDTDASDNSSELNTSSDERCEINNVIIRSSSKGCDTGLRRVRGLVSRAQPKSSPLYAPKEITEAQAASGENKVAALLHRSQWKQKRKWWTVAKKSVKTQAPTGLRPHPPATEPIDTAAVGAEAGGRAVEGEPMAMVLESRVTEHPLPSGSPGSSSPTNVPETPDWTPGTASILPISAVMTPKELAASMNGKVKQTGGTRKMRSALVYTLLDQGRTVVKKGERIPPHTHYQARDEKGTSLR